MKRKHRDIARMMAKPPTQEARNHEKRVAKEIEKLERIGEERLERMSRRKFEWNARRAQKTTCTLEQSPKTTKCEWEKHGGAQHQHADGLY